MNISMKFKICTLLFFTSFVFASITQADDLYDIFRNPPAAERPFMYWDWPAKLPGNDEIIRQLDAFKNSGLGGVEIAPAEITLAASKSLKFAADEAKKRELLVDLALPWPLTAPSLEPDESARSITLDKKYFNNLSAALAPSFGGNLGYSLHAISFNKFDLLNERFLAVFNDFCRGNAVFARLELPENPLFPGLPDANLPFDIQQCKIVRNPREHNFIASATGHFAVQPPKTCRFSDDPCLSENQPYFFGIHDIAFVSGINQFICTERNSGPRSHIERNARLCAVFRNSRLNIRPTVEISPANPNLLFINYVAGDRDIFFFTNIDRTQPLSFNARFETGDKIPWLWDPETGNRNLFHSGSSRNSLDIELDHLDSILLVFEPNLPDNPAALNKKLGNLVSLCLGGKNDLRRPQR
jgi:hypothetical protein